MKRIIPPLMVIALIVAALAGDEKYNEPLPPCDAADLQTIAEIFKIFSLETPLLELLVEEDKIGANEVAGITGIIETRRVWRHFRRDLPDCAFVARLDSRLLTFFTDWLSLAILRLESAAIGEDAIMVFAEGLEDVYEETLDDLLDMVFHLRNFES